MQSNTLRHDVLSVSDRIMDFGPIASKKSKFTKYSNGINVYLDGHKSHSMYEILEYLDTTSPDRKQLTDYMVYHGQPDTPGTYLIDLGTAKSIMVTSNLASSMAKVLLDAFNANSQSDLFAIRVARANTIKFEILSFKQDYAKAAYYAGLNDVANPSTNLASKKSVNFRRYPTYKQGLIDGGHFTTLTIETLLEDGIAPEFLASREIKSWLNVDKLTRKFMEISAKEFNTRRNNLILQFDKDV